MRGISVAAKVRQNSIREEIIMESALTPLEKTEKLLYRFDHPKAGTWERVDLDIKRNRMGWGTVFLKDASGIPRKNCEIRVRQKSHDFQFGCNAFKLGNFADPGKNAAYEEFFKRVFNEAVVPFLWDSTEPEQGKFRFAADSPAMDRRPPADLLIDWCEQNRIAPKGHWMFCDNFVPRWLPRDSRDVMILVEKRIAELAERYASRVRKWDVVNESFTYHPRKNPAIGDAAVPEDYVRQIFKMAEKYFPVTSEFIYNDGTEISFRAFAHESSPMFLLADRLLRRGVKLDGLGLQFHLYGALEDAMRMRVKSFFDPAHILQVLDQLGHLRLPLHISEISIPTYPELPREPAEELQARLLRNFYRLWFSQENCSSIVYWNLCDKTALGDESRYDAGLISVDFKEKPSYRMLDQLINHEWHTECTIVTDENGEASWNGFYGEYELEFAGSAHSVGLTSRSENEYSFLLAE